MILRAINPQTEQDLLLTAYHWRSKPRKNRMPYEQFAADYPNQVVMGLFDPELIAIYFFHQIGETEFQSHFTSSRKADKNAVLAGARELVTWFQNNGLTIVAFVSPRNRPLCHFIQSAGLAECQKESSRHSDTVDDNLSPRKDGTTVEFRS